MGLWSKLFRRQGSEGSQAALNSTTPAALMQAAASQTGPFFRYSKGWAVFYQSDLLRGQKLGKQNFENICALITEERTKDSRHRRHAYDVVLLDVSDSDGYWANLVITTSDQGPRDENKILAKVFKHNNAHMDGSVEEIDSRRLRDPRCRVVAQAHFEAVTVPILQSPDNISLLLQELKDEIRSVRLRAIASLGGAGNVRAVEPLIDILLGCSDDSAARELVADALLKLGWAPSDPQQEIALALATRFEATVTRGAAMVDSLISALPARTRGYAATPLLHWVASATRERPLR